MRRLLACAVVLAGAAARATPLADRHIGGMVFVGPTEAHVSSLYWNPAAMGLMSGTHILVSLSERLEWTGIDRATISSIDGEPDPAGDRSFSGQSPLYLTPGGFAGVVTDFGTTNLTFGVAAFLPFADHIPDLDASLGYHALGGSLDAEATVLAAAYRAASWFYAGVTFGALFTKLDMQFLRDGALDACGAPPCSVEDPTRAERWRLDSEWNAVIGLNFDAAFWASAGVLVRLWKWWVGVSAIFPGLFSGEISKSFDVEVTDAGGTSLRGRGRARFRWPLQIMIGVRHAAFANFDLVIDASFTRNSVQDAIDLRVFGRELRDGGIPEWIVRRRGLVDSYAVGVGLEQPPATLVRFGARARLESSAVPPAALAADRIDMPKLELAAGLELRLTRHIALTGGGALALYLPADASPSAFSPRAAIDCIASGYDQTTAACVAAREGRAIPTAAGSYRRIAAQLSLGFALDWW